MFSIIVTAHTPIPIHIKAFAYSLFAILFEALIAKDAPKPPWSAVFTIFPGFCFLFVTSTLKIAPLIKWSSGFLVFVRNITQLLSFVFRNFFSFLPLFLSFFPLWFHLSVLHLYHIFQLDYHFFHHFLIFRLKNF